MVKDATKHCQNAILALRGVRPFSASPPTMLSLSSSAPISERFSLLAGSHHVFPRVVNSARERKMTKTWRKTGKETTHGHLTAFCSKAQ